MNSRPRRQNRHARAQLFRADRRPRPAGRKLIFCAQVSQIAPFRRRARDAKGLPLDPTRVLFYSFGHVAPQNEQQYRSFSNLTLKNQCFLTRCPYRLAPLCGRLRHVFVDFCHSAAVCLLILLDLRHSAAVCVPVLHRQGAWAVTGGGR